MEYDILRDKVVVDRKIFDEMTALIALLKSEVVEWQRQVADCENHNGQTLQQLKLTLIEKERDEARVNEVVSFCQELLATVAAKTTWTHTQRNAFDLLLISELEKLEVSDANHIPF